MGSANLEFSETLSTNICEIIAAERMEIGSHLREAHLAERLKVSRTPIRSALKSLESLGVLERRPNKGFFLKSPSMAYEKVSKNPVRTQDITYSLTFQLANDFIHSTIPRRFTETEVARQYSETKNNVKQATIEMEKEGWIQRLPGYGWEFKDFLTSPQTYEQCYRFRLLVEPAALREPRYQPCRKTLVELKRKQQKLLQSEGKCSASLMFNTGVEFHESIVSFARNAFLLESLQRANRLRRLMEYNVHSSRPVPLNECRDHLFIIELIEQDRYASAAIFLEEHLAHALKEKVGIAKKLLG